MNLKEKLVNGFLANPLETIKDDPGLFLGIMTFLLSFVICFLNILEYVYTWSYYCFFCKVDSAFIVPFTAKAISFSWIFYAIIAICLWIYSSVAIKKYIQGNYLRFFGKQAFWFGIILLSLVLFLSLPELWANHFHYILPYIRQNLPYILVLYFLFELGLNFISVLYIINLSIQKKSNCATNKSENEDKGTEEGKKGQEKKDETENEKKAQTSDPKNKLFRSVIWFLIFSVGLPFLLALSDFTSLTHFRLVDVNQEIFSTQMQTELEDYDITDYVVLYQNEDRAIISPCFYDDEEDTITIYTEYQHVLPLENNTFTQKNIRHSSFE